MTEDELDRLTDDAEETDSEVEAEDADSVDELGVVDDDDSTNGDATLDPEEAPLTELKAPLGKV